MENENFGGIFVQANSLVEIKEIIKEIEEFKKERDKEHDIEIKVTIIPPESTEEVIEIGEDLKRLEEKYYIKIEISYVDE